MKNTEAWKWIFRKGRSVLYPLLIFTGCNALLSVVSVWFALVSKHVIDVATGQRVGSLKTAFVVLVVFLLGQLLLQVVLNLMEVNISGKLEIKIKNSLFQALLKKQYSELEQYHTGELMNRLNSDVRIIVTGVITVLPTAVAMFVKVCSGFAVLYALAPILAVCILCFGPFLIVAGRMYNKKIKRLHKECQQSDGVTRSYMQEMLQNLLAVKAFENEDSVAEQAMTYQKKNFFLKKKRAYVSLVANVCLFLLFTAGYYVTLGWGAYRISQGMLTYGTLTAMLQLVAQLQSPFRHMSGLISGWFNALASAERLMELEALAEEKEVPCDMLHHDFEVLTAEHLSFSYPNVPVLEDVSFSVHKGECLAVIGQSGIGKSTLLKLMLAVLEPSEGKILLSGNGRTAEISRNTRSFFAYVPQRNMILSGTILENIRFYRNHVSDEEIARCAEIAEMNAYLKDLPYGLNTVLKEGGEGLSEGQIQRIAIARALLCDAPVLLLDEATSALDEQTECAILQNIKALTDKVCIVVSHRNAVFDICDCIMTLENRTATAKEGKK